MPTLNVRATVYFNESRGSRFERYCPTAELVPSRHYDGRPLAFEVAEETLAGRSARELDLYCACLVYADGNRDDRPNGRNERSIAVGDVIVVHGPSYLSPDTVLAVESTGFRQLGRDEWPPRNA